MKKKCKTRYLEKIKPVADSRRCGLLCRRLHAVDAIEHNLDRSIPDSKWNPNCLPLNRIDSIIITDFKVTIFVTRNRVTFACATAKIKYLKDVFPSYNRVFTSQRGKERSINFR